ncbi:hypothetical protein LMG28614_06012 [Paraburkholderia ultramafica]|uniref:ParG protein n=1 Tax=Paraburkholderia ultramafica TaxID=1544867 RepID=A0A6S7BLS3_9BURK|nr:hypothetical protein [Paraburkholderia ultramafica]CAB3804336.1 hypothetical protein LMG28614_06012 [Paraburkholderia ultramafica]
MSKFKVKTGTMPPAEAPTSIESFAAGATLAQSQGSKRPPKPIRLNLDLDPELHRQLKLRAVTDGMTIAELVRGLIQREIGWVSKT